MKEKMPPFERPEPVIVGPASDEKKKEYEQMILKRFGERHYEQFSENVRQILDSLEYPKRPYEEEAIKQANEVTNILLKEFELRPFDVPKRNIHILPENVFNIILKELEEEKPEDITACTFQNNQLILLNAERLMHPIEKISTIFHEIIHLKNFFAIEAHEDLVKPYRSGLTISPAREKAERIGFYKAFSGLNEAVVTEIEKRYLPQLLQQNEFLAKEYQWQTSEKAQRLKNEIASKEKISPDEIIWISRDGKNYNKFPFYAQRRVLYYIVDQIYKNNPEEFNSPDDVMKLFFKAYFDGKTWYRVGRLINKSFDKDTFRIIGMMDESINSANMVMDYLSKKGRIKS